MMHLLTKDPELLEKRGRLLINAMYLIQKVRDGSFDYTAFENFKMNLSYFLSMTNGVVV